MVMNLTQPQLDAANVASATRNIECPSLKMGVRDELSIVKNLMLINQQFKMTPKTADFVNFNSYLIF